MNRTIHRFPPLIFAPVIAIAVAIALPGSAYAASVDTPSTPATAPGDKKDEKADDKKDAKPTDSKADPKTEKPADKKSDLDFRARYKYAYDTIYRSQDYAKGIVILSALGQDDHPDVANLIGFASRKLGRTEDAKVWYEKALAADPSHTRTWQYYGMWHLERGDRIAAEQHLERIRLICGQGCEDYTSLRDALQGNMTY
jgi:tetratricopeptide (TPR) repeat protein